MNTGGVARPRVLFIDDDDSQLALVERFLSGEFETITAESGRKGLRIIDEIKPDLILLDINMPDMDGYEVCARLQADTETAFIPVVFLTAMGEDRNRARAFAAGGSGFMVKPVNRNELTETIRKHLTTGTAWKELRADDVKFSEKIQSKGFIGFKEYVSARLKFDPDKKYLFSRVVATEIYSLAAELGIKEGTLSRFMSEYLDLPYISRIVPETIRLGVMPTAFCKANHVLPIQDHAEKKGFIISNPFDLDLIETLRKYFCLDRADILSVTEPGRLDMLYLLYAETPSPSKPVTIAEKGSFKPASAAEFQNNIDGSNPVVKVTDIILNAAAVERASDIHIEPKETETVVRFRVDGDLRHAFTLKNKTGKMIIARLKVHGGIDIAEKRKPQDGGFMATLDNRVFNFRLSTTSTPNGESLVMRLLEPYTAAGSLEDLGMSDRQVKAMVNAAGRSSGMVLFVGATGSGKTTTIYSLLHAIDHGTRSIMSVEDPVEYRIPFVNQQQVNEKAGVSFEALLKTSVRQDPDVLFMGEVRDGFSAKMAVDFASTGHLTITSMHTTNATTAIFRLQRLGIDRGTMADTIIAIVAQKLLKKLCPHCKQTVSISPLEADMLAPFTNDIPSVVARPVGCPECRGTGYIGREGVYEVLKFDPEISEMVRSGESIASIRTFVRKRGDELISTQAIAKVRGLIFRPKDIFSAVLAEEETSFTSKPPPELRVGPLAAAGSASILVVEDDEDTGRLIARHLETAGYSVTVSMDGIDALMCLGKRDYDLIISDIMMPHLDGFKLLEMIIQKNIDVPVVFMTGSKESDSEKRGLELGAMDYIRKPINKETLLLRIQKVLKKR